MRQIERLTRKLAQAMDRVDKLETFEHPPILRTATGTVAGANPTPAEITAVYGTPGDGFVAVMRETGATTSWIVSRVDGNWYIVELRLAS